MIRYLDAWGDLWERINDFQVRRIKDGMIGNWQDGQGLVETKRRK